MLSRLPTEGRRHRESIRIEDPISLFEFLIRLLLEALRFPGSSAESVRLDRNLVSAHLAPKGGVKDRLHCLYITIIGWQSL